MLRKLAVLGAAVALPLVGCSEAPTTPQVVPQLVTTAGKATISGTITHPCTGEDIVYEGTAHTTTSSKTQGDITTLRLTANTSNVQGVGVLSGAKYVLVEGTKQTQELSFTPPFPYVGEVFVRDRWQSQGGSDNFLATTRYTITFDGVTTTTEIHKMEAECTG